MSIVKNDIGGNITVREKPSFYVFLEDSCSYSSSQCNDVLLFDKFWSMES